VSVLTSHILFDGCRAMPIVYLYWNYSYTKNYRYCSNAISIAIMYIDTFGIVQISVNVFTL